MGIFETFSKRLLKKGRAGQPDVFQYDQLPAGFRVQVIHIWSDLCVRRSVYGEWRSLPAADTWWDVIESTLSRELGVFNLSQDGQTGFERCQNFLLSNETSVLNTLDLIELSFRVLDSALEEHCRRYPHKPKQSPEAAIAELNARFCEHAIGYEFINGELIRKDSQFIHAEATRPALTLLADAKFNGANQEFLRAHEHHRKGRQKEAMQDALKAFESTLKTICDQRGWTYKPTDTAKPLIAAVLNNDLVPRFCETHLAALRTVLESGLPTVRNKLAGHGQGAQPVAVPAYYAAYALHLAASNIVLLLESHKAKK